MEEFKKDKKLFSLFKDIEMPLADVLVEMQFNGIKIEKDKLLDFGVELEKEIQELEGEIIALAGIEFNVRSNKQLGEVLFERLELTPFKKNKTGYVTDVEALNKIRYKHAIVDKILKYRQYTKLNSTYVKGLIPYINERDSRIHSKFHQTITATGRISSSDPNMQNIPTRTELGSRIRKAFVASDNSVLISADYSQIELRVLASMSGDENMLEAFSNNQDIHQYTASKIFNIPLKQVTKEERKNAKAVNFGIIYGISNYGLSEQTGLSFDKAKDYIDSYLKKYETIDKFLKKQVEDAKLNGYVETLYGRRRYIPEIKSPKYNIREFGKRAAMNAPIQGTAADIMKIAMIKVYNRIKKENLESKLVLQIHDEIIIDTKKQEVDKIEKILKEEMMHATELKTKLLIDIEKGETWDF